VRRCLVKGSVLRSVACLPTHPVLPIAPSQRIYIIHRDLRIYMGIYMCGDIYGSMYVWRRERARPPLRLCGVYVDMWDCMCGGGRERARERGRGGGRGGGEKQQQPFVKTTRQAQHISSKSLDKHRTPINRHYNSDLKQEVMPVTEASDTSIRKVKV
jgi:hypothetical protein